VAHMDRWMLGQALKLALLRQLPRSRNLRIIRQEDHRKGLVSANRPQWVQCSL